MPTSSNGNSRSPPGRWLGPIVIIQLKICRHPQDEVYLPDAAPANEMGPAPTSLRDRKELTMAGVK